MGLGLIFGPRPSGTLDLGLIDKSRPSTSSVPSEVGEGGGPESALLAARLPSLGNLPGDVGPPRAVPVFLARSLPSRKLSCGYSLLCSEASRRLFMFQKTQRGKRLEEPNWDTGQGEEIDKPLP